MIKQLAKFAADSSNPTSTPGSQFEFVGAVQFAYSGVNVPPAGGDFVDNTDHSNADLFINGTDLFINNSDHSAGVPYSLVIEDSVNASGDVHSIDQQSLVASSAADFADLPGTSQGLIVETRASFDASLNDDNLSDIFDHIDDRADGSMTSTVGGAFGAPSGHSFDSSAVHPVGLPNVLSDAKGHGGGGGGPGGGTTPAPYTTHSGTGVDFHITYDSSVGNAPVGFTSVVQQVADFFASSFQDSTAITVNVAVGFGEVDGMRLGIGAIGESVTNLQDVSYSQLAAAYSTSGLGLSLGSSLPAGNLYVSNAEAKALGISITSPQTVDGWVGFSSKNGIFGYNNADGVSSNHYDFFGVVAHEISEVMGRLLLAGGSINNAPSYVAYDLFHYSSPGVQDFLGNGGYFSNDQGATNLAYFNNASNGGDAGDWASSGTSISGGSVNDAFNAFGTSGVVAPVSHPDLLALQAVLNLHLVGAG